MQKTVVITGAAGGLGRALVAVVESDGHRVIAVQRRPGMRADAIATDLSDAERASADIQTGLDALAPLGVDVLINNAGVGFLGPLATTSTMDMRRVLEINVVAPAALTRVMWPSNATRSGRILNVGSIASRLTIPTLGAYAASKRALLALTEATRVEGRTFGIQAGYIELGNVATGLHERVVLEAADRLQVSKRAENAPLRRMMSRSAALATDVGTRAMNPAEAAARIWAIAKRDVVPRLTTIGKDAWRRRLITACLPHGLIEWQLSRLIDGPDEPAAKGRIR